MTLNSWIALRLIQATHLSGSIVLEIIVLLMATFVEGVMGIVVKAANRTESWGR